MKHSLASFFLLFISFFANSQSANSIIVGGTIHIGNGVVITDGFIEFANGKIIKIGQAKDLTDTSGKKIAYYPEKHIYPGLISLYSSIGLNEIDAVRATRDSEEAGSYNPNIRSSVAYNIDSDIIPTVRSNGILMAQVTPRGGIIAGSSSAMLLDGWNAEQALYKANEGIHLNWFSYYPYASQDADKHKDLRDKNIAQLTNFFTQAKAYKLQINPTKINLRFEAMKGLFDTTKTLYINAWYTKDIIESVNFALSFGIKKIVIVGAGGSADLLEFLKQNQVKVILYRLHGMPARSEDAVNSVYTLPKILKQAGINFALCYYGDMEEMGSRNLPFTAGTAAAYGISKEDALRSITLSAAEILGIEKTTGSLEIGKDATLIISEGDILEMKTNSILKAYIKGKDVNLNDKHKTLYSKYSQKYGLK